MANDQLYILKKEFHVGLSEAAFISISLFQNLPNAAIVFDSFHVIKDFNDKLSDFRRTLYNELKDQIEKFYSKSIQKALKD